MDITGLSLEKGTLISISTVERVTQTSVYNYKDFRLKLLLLRDRIIEELSERGEYFDVVTEDDGIKILDDREAIQHTKRRRLKARREIRDGYRRQTHRDTTGFTEEEMELYRRELVNHGRDLQALKVREGRTLPTLTPHKAPTGSRRPNAVQGKD